MHMHYTRVSDTVTSISDSCIQNLVLQTKEERIYEWLNAYINAAKDRKLVTARCRNLHVLFSVAAGTLLSSNGIARWQVGFTHTLND